MKKSIVRVFDHKIVMSLFFGRLFSTLTIFAIDISLSSLSELVLCNPEMYSKLFIDLNVLVMQTSLPL